jgi:hypothetical protein
LNFGVGTKQGERRKEGSRLVALYDWLAVVTREAVSVEY